MISESDWFTVLLLFNQTILGETMFCSKCGIQLPENAIVCYQCATPTRAGELLQNSAEKSQPTSQNDAFRFLILGVVVSLIIGASIVVASNFSAIGNLFSSSSQSDVSSSRTTTYDAPKSEPIQPQPNTRNSKPQQPIETPIQQPPPQKETVIDKTFFVAARSFETFSFKLNRDAHLTGQFSAQGGKNDIDCLVVDDDNFTNFQNQTTFRVFYQSDYVSVGRVDLRLAAGNYHIIFNNRIALLTNKTVTAKFAVE